MPRYGEKCHTGEQKTMISTCETVRVGRLHGIAEGVASTGMDGDEVLTDGDKVRDDDTTSSVRYAGTIILPTESG